MQNFAAVRLTSVCLRNLRST